MHHPELLQSSVDRRWLFKAIGTAGAAMTLGAGLPRAAFAGAPLESDLPSPFDLHFTVRHRHRPFDLLAPGFVLHRGERERLDSVVRAQQGPRAPYATVVLDVTQAGSGVQAGLATDSNAVVVVYDADAGSVSVQVTRDGRTSVVGTRSAALGPKFHLAFVLNENFVIVLVDTGEGWRPLLRERVNELVDLRDPQTLAQYTFAYGPRRSGEIVELGAVEAGYFGQAGVRDPHLVTYADGTPYVRDGKAYLTMTSAGLGFFQTAHWGVWQLDLAEPSRLQQVAHLFFDRGGLLLGDHAGHVVFDDTTGEFVVAVSGWGDFDYQGVDVHITRTSENVLSGVHVLSTQPMALPTHVSAWDPALTRIGGTWHVAFVESPSQDPFLFHPALAVGAPGGGLDELTLVGADTSVDQTEGTLLQKIGDRWYLLTSDGDARNYRVYDLDVRFLGTLNAPYGTNIPHPMIIPVPEADRTRYVMVTFDGTQYAEPVLGYGTHGDFVVMTAPESRPGYEFPPRR